MLGDLNGVNFLLPPMLLSTEELDRQKLLDDVYGKMAQIASSLAVQWGSLKIQKERIERLARQARLPTVKADLVYQQAEETGEVENRVARELQPTLDNLAAIAAQASNEDADDKINRAIRRYAEEAIDIGVSWLELIQNYRIEWLRIASEKGKARPIISSADELEREFTRLTEDAG